MIAVGIGIGIQGNQGNRGKLLMLVLKVVVTIVVVTIIMLGMLVTTISAVRIITSTPTPVQILLNLPHLLYPIYLLYPIIPTPFHNTWNSSQTRINSGRTNNIQLKPRTTSSSQNSPKDKT